MEKVQETEAYVYLASKTNSTMFTTCCEAAITNSEKQCPKCEKYVYGHDYIDENSRRIIRWNYAFRK